MSKDLKPKSLGFNIYTHDIYIHTKVFDKNQQLFMIETINKVGKKETSST